MRKPLSVLTILVAVQLAVPFWTVAAQREDVKRVLASHHRIRFASQSPIISRTSARIMIGGGSFA